MALGDRIANVQTSMDRLRNPLAAGAQIRESGLDRQQRGMESALQAQAELNRQSEAGMKQLSDIGDTFVQRGVEKRAHANRLQMMREEHKEARALSDECPTPRDGDRRSATGVYHRRAYGGPAVHCR